MSNRKKGRRPRSRRGSSNRAPAGGVVTEQREQVQASSDPDTPRKRKARGPSASAPERDRSRQQRPGAGELDQAGRPVAPWHPLPLSEILILVGGIGLVIGVIRGVTHGGGAPALAGLAAAMLGTIEVTWREHRSGFRSHTVLLSLLPVVALHSVVVLAVSQFTKPPTVLNIGLLALDAALFVVLFRFMRARFVDARRSRVFSGQRRRG